MSPETDEAAILLALEPRVSCNKDVDLMGDSVNEGIGLTVVYRMVKDAGEQWFCSVVVALLKTKPTKAYPQVFG